MYRRVEKGNRVALIPNPFSPTDKEKQLYPHCNVHIVVPP